MGGCCCCPISEANAVAVAGVFSPLSEEVELARHPTLGEGNFDSEHLDESQPVIDTSKMEVDMLHGHTFVNQYLIIKEIGEGAFGKVKLVLNMEDNTLYALKMVSKLQAKRGSLQRRRHKGEANSNALLSEINVMKSLQHPNVVRLFEVINDASSDKLLMVLEYVDGGEVMREDMMGPSKTGFSEEVARRHFRDLVEGLDYLHYHNIIHRDIKPGNLLLTEQGRVKLSDFGSARYFPDGDDLVNDNAGTRLFYAPEACIQDNAYSGKKADVYAAGVVLYFLIFAKAPFEAAVDIELFEKIKHEEPDFGSRTDVSSELIDLLHQLLCKDPELRPGLEKVMNHPWFTDHRRLAEIKSSRFESLSADQSMSNDSGITPNISSILEQIPNKRQKRYRKDEYVVREGQEIDGWYLITTGHCEATSSEWHPEREDDFATGDLDFYVEEDDASTETNRGVLKALSNSNQESSSVMEEGVPLFQALDQQDVWKGIERRPTEKHGHIKQVVETAYHDYQTSSTDKFKLSRNGRLKGPGSVVGLDLSLESMECRQTIRALDEVHVLFVTKSALEEILTKTENRLQIRLLVARLQRIELMQGVVQNLATLHSDVELLEKLRSMFRHHGQNVEMIKGPESSTLS